MGLGFESLRNHDSTKRKLEEGFLFCVYNQEEDFSSYALYLGCIYTLFLYVRNLTYNYRVAKSSNKEHLTEEKLL